METIINKFLKLPKLLYFLVKDIPNKIIVPTFNTRNHLIPETRINLSKIEVISCGRKINTSKAKINSEKNTIVCVSRLEKGKGQDLLIKAFRKVLKEIPIAKLKIIGEGDFKFELEKLINKYKLENSVELLGRVKDSIQEIKKAEIVVFPSVWSLEGFGLVMIEAMSLSKACIAFNTGPSPEIIQDNATGLLAKNKDVNDLAKKIVLLLKSEKTRNRMGKQAKKIFNQKYQISSVAQKYDHSLIETINIQKAKKLVE